MTRAVTPTPDMIEVGRVMATLDDWRTMVYVLLVIISIMIVERGITAWMMRKEREKMWQVADKFGQAADKLGETTIEMKTQNAVFHTLFSRFETILDDRAAHREKPRD